MGTNFKTRQITFVSKPITLLVFIFLLGTALYLPSLSYDFVWDDHILIKKNPLIRSLLNGPRILISDFHITQGSIFYRPLVLFSFSLDYAFFKEWPGGYHLTNALLHGINSSLVAFLALLLFQNSWAALAAGAFFALHPAHPEAVAFISGRTDLLATLFSLLALIALGKKNEKNRDLRTLLFAPLFLFLALLAKETAVVVLIPMALLLYQNNREKQKKLGSVGLTLLPSGLMLILYLFLRYLALNAALTTNVKFKLFHHPSFLFELFLRYLSFFIFPPQRVSYFYNSSYSFSLDFSFWVLLYLTLLCSALIGYLIFRRQETGFMFALLILPCLPSLLFSLFSDIVMIERYLYLPSLGLALLVSWGLLLLGEKKRTTAWLGIGIILAFFLAATLWRTPLWKNEVVLFEALKNQYPSSPYIRSSLGIAYKDRNRLEEAYQEMLAAARWEPQNAFYRTGLGWLYLIRLGQIPLARAEFAEALKVAPHYASALEGMGLTYYYEGNKEKALEYLDKALLADPQNEFTIKNRQLVFSMKPAPKQTSPPSL